MARRSGVPFTTATAAVSAAVAAFRDARPGTGAGASGAIPSSGLELVAATWVPGT